MFEKIKNILKKQNQEYIKTIEEQIDEAFDSLNTEIITLKIGEDLVSFNKNIIEEIAILRENIRNMSGFILPSVRIIDNKELQENQFIIEIRGEKMLENFIIPNLKTVKKEIYQALYHTCTNNIDKVFSMEICEKYINFVQRKNSWLVWDISKQLNAYEIREILINILKNKKPIFDIVYIFEQIEKELLEDKYRSSWNLEKIAFNICSSL